MGSPLQTRDSQESKSCAEYRCDIAIVATAKELSFTLPSLCVYPEKNAGEHAKIPPAQCLGRDHE